MKTRQLKGYLKNFENKNKRFSFERTIKLLDVINYIYLDKMKEFDYIDILNYKNAKYLFNEIVNQFKQIYEFLNDGKILMAICLLRNVYEIIIYIMATSISNIEVNVSSSPKEFRKIVKDNYNQLLSDYFEIDDIDEIYQYLSKLTHVTNLKEATSYLLNVKKYIKYVTNEIKFMTILIEYMYLSFLYKKTGRKEDILCADSIIFGGYIEIINLLYFIANSDQSQKYLKKYFYGEKNQNYIEKHNKELLNILNDFRVEKNNINVTIKKVAKEFDKLINESKYLEIANKILK